MRLRCFAAAAIVLSAIATAAPAAETDDAAARLAAAQAMFVVEHRLQNEEIRIQLFVDRAARQFKAATPNASDADVQRYATVLREEMEHDAPQLLQLRAQYYASHLTLAELKEWTRMLETDTGQKILSAEPDMMRDMYNVDYAWMKDAMQRANARYSRTAGEKPL